MSVWELACSLARVQRTQTEIAQDLRDHALHQYPGGRRAGAKGDELRALVCGSAVRVSLQPEGHFARTGGKHRLRFFQSQRDLRKGINCILPLRGVGFDGGWGSPALRARAHPGLKFLASRWDAG